MGDDVGNDADATPLVSIVMLAFNQRELIGEAIASLLAQDYSNFELIVSDDCSSDGTFEKMQEIAASYAGPHAIRVNRTATNRGTLSHLYHAVACSKGRLIVGAGGDDISLPHRVSTLVKRWRETGADALFSSCTVVDAQGTPIFDGSIWLDQATQSYFPGRRAYKIAGAMAAYDRTVFETIALPDETVWCEDIFFSLMLHYRGGTIEAVPDRLVLYRNHRNSLTNSHQSTLSAEAGERKAKRLYTDYVGILRRFHEMVEDDRRHGNLKSDVDVVAVRRMRTYYEFAAGWMDMTLVQRLRHTAALRSSRHVGWAMPRLLGLPAFVRMKALQRLVARAR